MATSGEISQMFTAQNEQFIARNSFANTIGIASPFQGLGAYGRSPFMGGFQPVGGGFPGMAGPPPVWSYGSNGPFGSGYGGGNSFGGNMIAGMGGAATLGMAGLGLAAGFGKLGGMGSMLFDPISSGWGGFAASRAMGVGMMGSLGAGAMAAMPAMAVGALATGAIGSFVHGAQNQQAIAGQLGQHQFFNPASRTGMGFTRDDAKQFGDSVRHLAHVPEMLTSVEELTRLLPQLRKAGSFQGVKDIGEFQDRFKESIKTIKQMSKMLGTTMEEASEFFAHSRSVGFLGKQSQLQNVLNAQFTSGMTGMSVGQVMGLQQQGAAMWRQQGMSGRIGAQAVANWAQQLGYAQQNGTLGEGVLEDITGLQGPEAVAAASQKFAQAGFAMTQDTSVGRLLAYGLAKFDENGKAIGVDQDRLDKFNRRELSYHDFKRFAGNLTDAQKESVTARLKDVGGLVAATTGPGGISNFYVEAMKERYGGNESRALEAANLLIQRNTGMSANEADVVLATREQYGPDSTMKDAMGRIRMREAAIKEKYSPAAMWKRFKTKVHAATFAHLEQFGADVETSLSKAWEGFVDDVVGRHAVNITKGGADAFRQAMAGNQQGLARLFDSASPVAKIISVLGGGGLGQGIHNQVFGSGTAEARSRREALENAQLPNWDDKQRAAAVEARRSFIRDGFVTRGGSVLSGGTRKMWDELSPEEQKTQLLKRVKGTLSAELANLGVKGGGVEFERDWASGSFGSKWGKLDAEYGASLQTAFGTANPTKAAIMAKLSPQLRAILGAAGDNFSGSLENQLVVGLDNAGKGDARYQTDWLEGLSNDDIANVSRAKQNVSDELTKSGLDVTSQNFLAGNDTAANALHAALNGNEEVMKALQDRDSDKLAKLGMNLSSGDAERVFDMYLKTKGKGGSKDIAGKIKRLKGVTDFGQLIAMGEHVNEGAKRFGEALNSSKLSGDKMKTAIGIKDAMSSFGFYLGKGNKADALSAASDLRKAMGGLSSFSDAELSQMGEVGQWMLGGRFVANKYSRNGMSIEDLAKEMGASKDSAEVKEMAGKLGIDLGGKKSKINKDQLAMEVAQLKSGSLTAAGGTSTPHDKDGDVVTAMRAIAKNSELQTSLLYLIAKDKGGEALVNGYKDVSVTKDGKVSFSEKK